MAFSIEKHTVTAVTRALKAEYTMELAQDLKAIHGLDAETELANILSAEILAEINREVVRNIYVSAVKGASANTTTAGIFDLDTDSNGRWSVEKFKGLMFANRDVMLMLLVNRLVEERVTWLSVQLMLLLHFRWLVFLITLLL
jgi:hypothetical protein